MPGPHHRSAATTTIQEVTQWRWIGTYRRLWTWWKAKRKRMSRWWAGRHEHHNLWTIMIGRRRIRKLSLPILKSLTNKRRSQATKWLNASSPLEKQVWRKKVTVGSLSTVRGPALTFLSTRRPMTAIRAISVRLLFQNQSKNWPPWKTFERPNLVHRFPINRSKASWKSRKSLQSKVQQKWVMAAYIRGPIKRTTRSLWRQTTKRTYCSRTPKSSIIKLGSRWTSFRQPWSLKKKCSHQMGQAESHK